MSIAVKRERMCTPPPYQLFHLSRYYRRKPTECAPRQNYKLRPKYPAREISDIKVKFVKAGRNRRAGGGGLREYGRM